MKTIKILGINIEPFSEYDYESIIKNFWMHSVTNRMNEFDFATAFKSLREPIERKLNEHALLGYENFLEWYDEVFYHEQSNFEAFTYQTNYIYISVDDVREAIAKMHYEKSVEAFDGLGSFETLKEIYEDLNDWHGHSEEWKIKLFDKVIHAQHESGDIFEDCDIESLREKAEEEINELLGINP